MTLREQLIRDEGDFQLKPYRDSAGKLTIGCGRNLDDVGLSREEAELLLDHDLQRAVDALRARVPWVGDLEYVRYAVLVNMTFNLGIGGLLGFQRMLDAARRGAWETVAHEMLDSRWAEQVGPRAHRLAEQMRVGEWR